MERKGGERRREKSEKSEFLYSSCTGGREGGVERETGRRKTKNLGFWGVFWREGRKEGVREEE